MNQPWLIEADSLSKQFQNSPPWAVKDLSFKVGAGEVIGLIGENGAGKSTLLRMLATMLKPTSGSVRIDGFDTMTHAEHVRSTIGILFTQQSGLYERLTARENIHYFADLNGLPKSVTNTKLLELSTLLEMDDFLDRRAGTFSTGMRQKTLIARSIIHDPKILMLDEPSTGLDVTSSKSVHNFITWCKEVNKTVIFSSHDLGVVEKISDKILMMHKGELLAWDTPKAIAHQGTLEERFFKLQESAQ